MTHNQNKESAWSIQVQRASLEKKQHKKTFSSYERSITNARMENDYLSFTMTTYSIHMKIIEENFKGSTHIVPEIMSFSKAHLHNPMHQNIAVY